jgi:hypothetical protein
VKKLFASPRRRRRAGWIAGTAVLAGTLTFVGLHWSNTGRSDNAPFTTEPVQTVANNPPSVAFTGKTRDTVRGVASRFIATAVIRRHLDESWDLVTPSLRQGYTRAAWRRGAIPIVPYPAKALGLVKSRLDYSYSDRVALKVAIFPKVGAKVRAQTFEIELQNLGGTAHPHWLVSYWAPAGFEGIPSTPAGASAASSPYKGQRGIGAIWLLVPVGLVVGSILAVLLLVGVRGWRRHARAMRAQRAYNSSSSPS